MVCEMLLPQMTEPPNRFFRRCCRAARPHDQFHDPFERLTLAGLDVTETRVDREVSGL